MMEIDALLRTKKKREDYFKAKKERLSKVKDVIEDQDTTILEELED